MKTIFVSRHPGAAGWAAAHGFADVEVVTHFVPSGEAVRVIGTLPVQLAAAVFEAGGEYHHLTLTVPAEMRGTELSAAQMDQCGACVERFYVVSEGTWHREMVRSFLDAIDQW